MTDFDKWAGKDIPIDKQADIEKEERCRKEIEKLVENCEWKLEKITGSYPDYRIFVKTEIPFDTRTGKRCLLDIKEFKGKLEGILKEYGLGIRNFYDKDKSDDGYRRIEIKLKRTSYLFKFVFPQIS